MRQVLKSLILSACVVLTTAFVSAADAKPSVGPFKVVNKFALEGEGRWDYLVVDNDSRRLFVSRSTHVAVLDADSGAELGDIPNTPGVHGVALASDLGVGFVSDGGENKVTIGPLINGAYTLFLGASITFCPDNSTTIRLHFR